MKNLLLISLFFISQGLFAQYTMSNLTVYDCEGTLTDSEANTANAGWYAHNENFLFTICPNGALSITMNFTFFETEPGNDYVMIYDGPNNTYPVIGGPYSGVNLPPQTISSGCITIGFFSDINVAAEGFELNWESEIAAPVLPIISLPTTVSCSSNTIIIVLNQNIHCDSVYTALIDINGQISQTVNAIPLNCNNDSTNTIQLNVSPGFNESGIYNIYFQSYFLDACDSVWDLSTYLQFTVNDCPLQVNLTVNEDTICFGDCADLFVYVSGGDSTSYTYSWNPLWGNSPGVQTVCPITTTQYIVTVDDAGLASAQTDTILITVLPPPIAQTNISICQTDPPINLTANPAGGWWWGTGITNGANGTFTANNLVAGVYTVSYGFADCSDDVDVTVLEITAGPDIAACLNSLTFNLNSMYTTPGGVWSGCSCIQPNGDITVGTIATTINAIYTLPNGCSDTLLVIVGGIATQADDTLCQQSGNYPLTFSPPNGVWSVLPNNPPLPSSCPTSIISFPFQDGFELGLANWTQDPTNDFDWVVNNGGTNSTATGPTFAQEGLSYIYTEASNPNYPDKKAAIISPCLNLSAYSNPVLYFWYHKYGTGQGSFAIDVSVDNGATWTWNYWYKWGDLGNQWNEEAIDLSTFNTAEVLIRLRVLTGNWQSDVAVDHLSILGGPVTPDGVFLSSVADSGIHNLIYSINGCDDYVDLYVKPIDAGLDMIVCPYESPFNLAGSPNGGIWNGTHITNVNTGLFDPSLGLGIDWVTYTFDGCVDTARINVVDTDVQIDSLFFCSNEGVIQLDAGLVPRTPWNGTWSGNGIISNNYPGEFSPNMAGAGIHTITYTANTCTDDLIIIVYPQSILLDTLICYSSSNIILNVTPTGGNWMGNGIVNNNTGLFSPTQVGVGTHMIGYIAPSGCIDTFYITIYNAPTLTVNGLDNEYCFKDTNIQVIVSPLGGVLSGDGVSGLTFNPSLAGIGYHTITYSYGLGICLQTIDVVVFVADQLMANTYTTDDTICVGDMVIIGVTVNGGTMNYSFVWNNGLSNSFEHIVAPNTTINYVVTIDDGCSTPTLDTISIFVQPTFNLSFTTSEKQCYGSEGFAHVVASPAANYSYSWNSNPITITDSLIAAVAKEYQVDVKDKTTNCSITDTITIPGFSVIIAAIFTSNTECVSVLDAFFQFNDNSAVSPFELSAFSIWDFGDGTTTPYVFSESPQHTYSDTGFFNVILYLENIGGCYDSVSHTICIVPDNRLFIPNSFTPNDDFCNDEFYAKGLGGFHTFNIKIHKRWGSEVIFKSDEILISNNSEDGNICNSIISFDSYYKLGSWDGVMLNGLDAPQGVYPYVIHYQLTELSLIEEVVGYIILIK